MQAEFSPRKTENLCK